jgi:hypothetical protein
MYGALLSWGVLSDHVDDKRQSRWGPKSEVHFNSMARWRKYRKPLLTSGISSCIHEIQLWTNMSDVNGVILLQLAEDLNSAPVWVFNMGARPIFRFFLFLF